MTQEEAQDDNEKAQDNRGKDNRIKSGMIGQEKGIKFGSPAVPEIHKKVRGRLLGLPLTSIVTILLYMSLF
jgi:hypothetical protein